MHPAITTLEKAHRKPTVPMVQSGDTVRVHQLIREGAKQRIQIFEGVVIRTDRMNMVSASITVRRIASGVGVEKTFLLHSPIIDKLEIMRRGKVRRNFLSYLRDRRGKSARLKEISFDKVAANAGYTLDNGDDEIDVPDVPSTTPSGEDDAAITEINPDQEADELNEPDVISTEELIKEENRDAAADEPKPTDGGGEQGDESVLEQTEAESGVDRAEPNKQ